MGRPQFQWAFPFAPNRPNMRSTSMWFSWHAMYVGVAPSLWFSHVSTDVVKYAELMFVISLICICCVVIMAYRSCSFGYEQKILGRVVVGLQKLSAICVARVQSVVMTHVMLFMLSCLWHVLHNQCCTISVARVAWNLLLLVLHNPRCTFLSSAVLLIEFDCFQSSGPWCILWTLFRFLVGINSWNSLVFLMIFPSWFRWLVFRIVLDGFWRQYITTVWYLRERIHLHRSSWGLDVALMFVRRCLIFVLCRLHRPIITARQQQLRSNSLGTRSRRCFPPPACQSCFGLSLSLRCCFSVWGSTIIGEVVSVKSFFLHAWHIFWSFLMLYLVAFVLQSRFDIGRVSDDSFRNGAIVVCARHLFVGWFWFGFWCCFWCRVLYCKCGRLQYESQKPLRRL